LNSTLLTTWLATMFPNLYGVNAGSNNLLNYHNTGKAATNAQVAAYFQALFSFRHWLLTAPHVDSHDESVCGPSNRTPETIEANETLAQHLWNHRDELFTFLRQPGLAQHLWNHQ
jgi:hypothetical protein